MISKWKMSLTSFRIRKTLITTFKLIKIGTKIMTQNLSMHNIIREMWQVYRMIDKDCQIRGKFLSHSPMSNNLIITRIIRSQVV